MRILSATECIIIIGYDDEEGDAHFYTVTATMREIRKAGSTEEFIKSIISETKIKNVFLKRWIYENGVIDY